MAGKTGCVASTVHRIRDAFSLQPHRSGIFRLPADPFPVDKTRGIIGLHVVSPQHAMVLCVDEEGSGPGP